MRLKEITSAMHTDKLVVYDGYEGDMQEPVADLDYLPDGIQELNADYGDREVAVLECFEDTLYVWLSTE